MRKFLSAPPLLRSRLAIVLCVTLIFASSALTASTPLPASSSSHDFAQTNGQFFTQTGDRPGTGFDVRDDFIDDDGRPVRFWSEFNRLGGVDVLGYPISRIFRSNDGLYYQLFQRALLQWHPEADVAVFANLMDQLTSLKADQWLSDHGVPAPVADDGSHGDFAAAVQTRLGWLTEPHIAAFYLSGGGQLAAMERYGLPASAPVRSGPFVVQRFQRVSLQVWLDSVPGMPAPGTVVPILAGDLYRQYATTQLGSLADQRFVPQAANGVVAPAPGTRPSAIADDLKQPLALLQANPEGQVPAKALTSADVRIVFESVPAIAIFSASRMTISVDPQWAHADPKTLAAVLAHEGSHLADYLSGIDMSSPDGCYRTEFVAFQTQARVWSAFYGPAGKAQPATALDSELNQIQHEITTDPAGFNNMLRSAYRDECG